MRGKRSANLEQMGGRPPMMSSSRNNKEHNTPQQQQQQQQHQVRRQQAYHQHQQGRQQQNHKNQGSSPSRNRIDVIGEVDETSSPVQCRRLTPQLLSEFSLSKLHKLSLQNEYYGEMITRELIKLETGSFVVWKSHKPQTEELTLSIRLPPPGATGSSRLHQQQSHKNREQIQHIPIIKTTSSTTSSNSYHVFVRYPYPSPEIC